MTDEAIQAAADELEKWQTQDFSEPAVRWSAAVDALFAAVRVDGPVYLWCRVHRRLWSRSVCGSVCDDFMRLVEVGEETE